MEQFAAFSGLIFGGLLTSVGSITWVAVQVVKKFCPKIQGVATAWATGGIAIVFTLSGLAGLHLLDKLDLAQSILAVLLNCTLSAALASGIDTGWNTIGIKKLGGDRTKV